MDIEGMLRKAFEQHMKEMEGEPFKSTDEALKALNSFLSSRSDLQVGDRVERNAVGMNRYNMPKAGQVAVVVEKFDEFRDDGEQADADIRIAIAVAKDNYRFYTVDSRYYKKVEKKDNIFTFKRSK